MFTLAKWFILVLTMATLLGCKNNETVQYLMQHPAVLKQQLDECQVIHPRSKEQLAQCETIKFAATNMMTIMYEMQQNPEKFGQRILHTEMLLSMMKDKLQQAEQAVATLAAKQAGAVELQLAQDQLAEAKKAYQRQHDELKVILAVVGLNSPE